RRDPHRPGGLRRQRGGGIRGVHRAGGGGRRARAGHDGRGCLGTVPAAGGVPMTGAAMSKEQAAAAVKAAVAERDAIQANLLELDSSFGRQLLAGAELTGTTKRRWDATSVT